MARVHPHESDARPVSDLFYNQWLYLITRTVEVEVLNHAYDALSSFLDGDRLAQRLCQSQYPRGGLVDDDRIGVGRFVGQGASLGHTQSHNFDKVAICLIHSYLYLLFPCRSPHFINPTRY